MAPQATWKGFLNVSLVSLGVKAYSASASDGGAVRLHQLHQDCHCRIQHQKKCPAHGAVTSDQIVMGYPYAQDQYVVVDPSEIDKLRSPQQKRSIQIETFVPDGAIGFLYFTDRHYYLVPDGAAAGPPYALLREAMQNKRVHALAQVVLSKKEQLVLVRPLEEILCMTVLKYAAQVRLPCVVSDETPPSPALAQEESRLAQKLIQCRTKRRLDYAQYEDQYTQKLVQLIETKRQGRQLVAAPDGPAPSICNLLDALQASLAEQEPTGGSPTTKLAPDPSRPRRKRPATASSKSSVKKKSA